MRNLFLLVAISIIAVSCNKDQNNGNNSSIIIKGNIPTGSKSSQLKAGSTLSLSDAKKVLVFSRSYYSLSDIVDGSFSVNGQIGTGVALIFLDANNKYIGNLSNENLNLLPLGNLSDGENTSIDLSSLTLEGTNVIPSHDPFGTEILISESEIARLKAIGEYYEAIAKNIDANNDNIPDVLSQTQLIMTTTFATDSCGHWGVNSVPPAFVDADNLTFNYFIEVDGGQNLSVTSDITLSGPVEDPYTDITTWGFHNNTAGNSFGFISSFVRRPDNSTCLPFKKGTYNLTLNNNVNTLTFSNIDAFSNLVLVAPTLNTDSNGVIKSITLEYRLPNGTLISDPGNILTNVMVQLDNKYGNGMYVNDKSKLTVKTGFSVIVPDQTVNILTVHTVSIGYQDLLGNAYIINWK